MKLRLLRLSAWAIDILLLMGAVLSVSTAGLGALSLFPFVLKVRLYKVILLAFLLVYVWFVVIMFVLSATPGMYILGLRWRGDPNAVLKRLGFGLYIDFFLFPLTCLVFILSGYTLSELLFKVKIEHRGLNTVGILFGFLFFTGLGIWSYVFFIRMPWRMWGLLKRTDLYETLARALVYSRQPDLAEQLLLRGIYDPLVVCIVRWEKAREVTSACEYVMRDPNMEREIKTVLAYRIVTESLNNPEIVRTYADYFIDLVRETRTFDEKVWDVFQRLIKDDQYREVVAKYRKYIEGFIRSKPAELPQWVQAYMEYLIEDSPEYAVSLLHFLDRSYELAWVKFMLGEYYYKIGEKGRAKEYFERCIELDPQCEERVAVFKL